MDPHAYYDSYACTTRVSLYIRISMHEGLGFTLLMRMSTGKSLRDSAS